MGKKTIEFYTKQFEDYFKSKLISPSISKKFMSSLNYHIKDNEKHFINFCKFLDKVKNIPLEDAIKKLNNLIISKDKGSKTAVFISEWSHSYLGPGEIICLLITERSLSGGKRNPDILFSDSHSRIEVKSYGENFRLTEATSFFTDLGTIIQALVQGGFLNSLTDANNNDLRKGLRHFSESFLCPRGYIELNSKIWKLELSNEETMVFKASPETSREMVNYSIVRNSLRNWLGRGMLSIKLAGIIDPTRKTKIQKKELRDYVDNILGIGDLAPIPLEQYFILCRIESMIIYEKKNKESPFQIVKFDDLNKFTLDRIGQAKVSYKRKLVVNSKSLES